VALLAAGVVSLIVQGGPRYGIDFKGGVVMSLRFAKQPSMDQIRSALSGRIAGEVMVQDFVGSDEVLVSTELRSETELAEARRLLVQTLEESFGEIEPGKVDLNNAGAEVIARTLRERNVPLADDQIVGLAERIREFRDTPPRSGLITDFESLSAVAGLTPEILASVKEAFDLAPFAIRSVEIVGPKIGAELRQQAVMATLLALAGMLIYIAFRFEWTYGVAAVAAVFHDVVITVGLFSITGKEISLTVIAAILTLVGYSMNDTIVIFDRVRENLKTSHRGSFTDLVNLAVNQCLNRTVLTSGLTFLTVLALLIFGGQVLNGFAFALTVGILVGTYSSVFIASPILISLQGVLESRKRARVVSAAPVKKTAAGKGPAKAAR
jgi:preprotein translocase subunit SecF